MGERRPSGVLGKLFGKDKELEDSEYVELPSPKSEKQKEQPPPQKTRSFRLSFLKPSGAGSNGADEDEAAQYRRFSARDEKDAKKDHIQDGNKANGRHHGSGADVGNSDLQLVPHSGAGSAQPTQQDQQEETELSIPQAIRQKATRWLERFRSQSAAASSSSPEAQSVYTSVHHIKASRYVDQGTLQSLSAATALIAADQRALVLASQPSSEGLWRERGKLAGLKAQRDGWVQKRDGLLEQLRLAEEKHAILKQQVQQHVIAERTAELQRQQHQQQLQLQQRTGVVDDVEDIRDGLTSTTQPTEATPDIVDDPSVHCVEEAADKEAAEEEADVEETEEKAEEEAEGAEETGYVAAPDGLELSDRSSEDTRHEAEVAAESFPDEHDER